MDIETYLIYIYVILYYDNGRELDKMIHIDLHTHSTASDGQYTPSELIQLAIAKDIKYFALTDHDTVSGISEAVSASEKYNKALVDNNLSLSEIEKRRFDFIPGIEISTHDGCEIHILGLNIDYKNPKLLEACNQYMEERDNRGPRIQKYMLEKKNIKIDLGEVAELAGDGSLGRPHFAKWLVNHNYVRSIQEAFDRYLNSPEFHMATDRTLPSPQEAIALIHEAGGIAVLAHPGLLKMGRKWQESLISELVSSGLDGIEACYYKHTFIQTKNYKKIAQKYNLFISYGSDFHGEKVKSSVPLGMEAPDDFNLIINEHKRILKK